MQERQSFVATMERQFGSEAALGVRFRLESGEELLAADYDIRFASTPIAQHPDMESLLADGGSAVCCTDYATFIYNQLPGRVKICGFANECNPTSRVAREEIHPGGHDFAVVDGRYIVDPWPRLVPAVFNQMVFDMSDPADAALVADIYGPRECWEHMQDAEAYARGRLTV